MQVGGWRRELASIVMMGNCHLSDLNYHGNNIFGVSVMVVFRKI